MVSLRLDIDLWNELAKASELGLISSREQAVNEWLRQRVDQLFADYRRWADAHADDGAFKFAETFGSTAATLGSRKEGS